MPEQLGKYTLTELIAVGGMAEIFRARTTSLGGVEKTLAIKRLHEHYCSDRDFVDMLVNEARIAVRLNHKNICQVFDLEKEGNAYFIAMEYIHGRDLSRVLRRFQEIGRLMPLPCLVYIAQEMCSGLSFAHRMTDNDGQPLDIIHRDVSPQNILVSFEGEVKIVDFGIAKAASRAAMTHSGVIKGKFYYMSPEQARGDRLSQRADVFSMGAILYEMATGRMLYEGEDDAKLVQRVRMADYPAPSAVSPDIPPQLEQIILKALAKDVNQRFQTARDMQLALSGFMHSLGVTFDSISLSELMHSLFQTGADSSSAVYQVINERPHEQPAPMMTDQRFPPPPVDEDAQTSVYDRDHIGGIVDQIDALYGAESPPGAPRRAELPDVHRPVDIAIDRSIYQVNTVITDLEGQPISPSKPRPPMLLFLLALSGIVLLAWAFIFATNQLVLGRSPSSAGPVVQGAGQRDAVHIDSTPSGAVLWLDGKDTGLSTPAELMGISEGEHQISLRLPFHENYDSTLLFKAGAQFKAELKAKRGILKIDSVPPGAQIHVDGFFVGPAPVNVSDRDMAVPHRVAASLDGYKDLVTTAQWQRDEPILTVSLKLSRAELRFPDVAQGCLQGAAQAAAVFAYPRSQALPQPLEPAEPQNPSDEVDGKPDKEHKKPVSYGSISVQSKPPGTLYIDGKNTGMTTPVRALRVTAGYHDIKILDPETGTFSQEKRTLVRPSVDVKLFFRQ